MRNLFRRIAIMGFILPALQAHPAPMAARELKVVSGDVELFVRVAGEIDSGRVVLALNGGPGLSSRYMTDLEVMSGDDMALVTFDQRGVGRSTGPALELPNFGFDKYLKDIEAVRKALGVRSFHILGHSWGGLLALKYSLDYPDKVDSLILIGNAPITDAGLKDFLTKMRARVIELIRQGVIDGKLERHSDIYPAYLSDPRHKPSCDLLPDLNETVQDLTFEAIRGYDLTASLPGINKRVLMLWGEDDPLGPNVAAATRKALAGARVNLVMIKNCGHFWQENPREFLSRIRAFLIPS